MKQTILLTIALLLLLTLTGGCDNDSPRLVHTERIDTQEIDQIFLHSNEHIYFHSVEGMKKKPKNENLLTIEEFLPRELERGKGYEPSTVLSDRSMSIEAGFLTDSHMVLSMPATYQGDVEIECFSLFISSSDLEDSPSGLENHFFNKLYITSHKPIDWRPRVFHHYYIGSYLGIDARGKLHAEELKLTSFDTGVFCHGIIVGNANISTTSGEIHIDNFAGSGSIVSQSGDILVQITEINGDIHIENTEGDIRVYVHPSLSNYSVTTQGDAVNTIDEPEETAENSYSINIKNTSGFIRVDYMDEYPASQS